MDLFVSENLIPFIARRPRHAPLELLSSERFEEALVQNRYQGTIDEARH